MLPIKIISKVSKKGFLQIQIYFSIQLHSSYKLKISNRKLNFLMNPFVFKLFPYHYNILNKVLKLIQTLGTRSRIKPNNFDNSNQFIKTLRFK